MDSHNGLLPPGADRVVIAVNPKAGPRGLSGQVEHLVGLLRRQGFQPQVLTSLDEVAALASRWHAEGRLRALVGVGGDGTAAEMVNRTPPGLPITLYPAGNQNLLARYVGLRPRPEELCRTIAAGRLLRLDAGRANERVFLLMIGCGFDAEVVYRVHQHRTGHLGNLGYFKPIAQAIRSYQYPAMRVYFDENEGPRAGLPGPLEVRWLFAFNLPCYGAGLRLAPAADGTDSRLDLCAFRCGGLCRGLWYSAAVLLGRHGRLGDCTTARVQRLRVVADAEVRYQLDGDPGGLLPVDVEVLPGRVTLLVPTRA